MDMLEVILYQGVREGLLVTLIPHRGQLGALARRYKRRSDTFRTHLVYIFVNNFEYHNFNKSKKEQSISFI